MSSVPFFSIILPVYNVEKFLDRCIQSIQKQNFTDYEIILVDDGSKDDSPRICDEWAKRDARIHVIHKMNAGLGLARNTGLEAAKGKYILFVDSDDYIVGDLLCDLFDTIKMKNPEFIFFGMRRVDSGGKTILDLPPKPLKMVYDNKYEIMNQLLPDFIGKNPRTGHITNLRISVCTSCIRKDFFDRSNLRFVSERQFISEDLWFYLEAFPYIDNAVFLSEVYYCYCQNEGSLTYSYKQDRYWRLKKFYQDANELANQLHYDGEVQNRLKASFIATTMACLKMETFNFKVAGFRETYCRINQMCSDTYMREILTEYSDAYFSKKWKIFKYCIVHEYTLLLMIILLAQYIVRHV